MKISGYWDDNTFENGIKITSCGHTTAYMGDQVLRPNGTNDYIIIYIAKGNEIFSFDNEVVVPEDSAVLFTPFEKHCHYHTESVPSEIYYIHFSIENNDVFNNAGLKSRTVYSLKPNSAPEYYFKSIINELQIKSPLYKMVCVANLYLLISLIHRKVFMSNDKNAKLKKDIANILQSINQNYHLNLNLFEFASQCNYSKYHFARVFKEMTGMSPIAYRNKIRLRHAKELLEESGLSVSEISKYVGYESPVYFCNTFHKAYGLSPREYRENLK